MQQHLVLTGQHLAAVHQQTQAVTNQILRQSQLEAERAQRHQSAFEESVANTRHMWGHLREQVSALRQGRETSARDHADQLMAAVQSMSGEARPIASL